MVSQEEDDAARREYILKMEQRNRLGSVVDTLLMGPLDDAASLAVLLDQRQSQLMQIGDMRFLVWCDRSGEGGSAWLSGADCEIRVRWFNEVITLRTPTDTTNQFPFARVYNAIIECPKVVDDVHFIVRDPS